MKRLGFAGAICMVAEVAFADGHAVTRGDAASGENQFNRQCGACHVVADASGGCLVRR